MKYSIVIIDDHLLIAKALNSIIANFKQFEVLYECENGKKLIEKFENSPKNIPNLVLLDINMPVMNGFETAQWIKENYPEILIMALSMQDDEDSIIKMIKNGARGYLLKNTHPSELEKALNALIKNQYYYPTWASDKIFSSLNTKKTLENKYKLISEREKEFLKYTVTEMNYKEIAEKMFCSPRTVEVMTP